jgi:hypothetical protein
MLPMIQVNTFRIPFFFSGFYQLASPTLATTMSTFEAPTLGQLHTEEAYQCAVLVPWCCSQRVHALQKAGKVTSVDMRLLMQVINKALIFLVEQHPRCSRLPLHLGDLVGYAPHVCVRWMVGIIADKTNLLTYGVHKQILILLQAILF